MRTPPTTAADTSSLPPLLLHQHDEDGTNNKVNNNNNNVYKRREVMQGHGFRKFFDTTSTIAGMNPVYIEFCMGHSLGLKGRYAKPSPTDLLEGNDKNLGYISAINDLTINEENRLRIEVETLRVEKSKIDELRSDLEQLRKSVLG